jgi:hypothetical protein
VQHGLDRGPLAAAAELTEHPLDVALVGRLVVDQVEHGPGVHLDEVLAGGGAELRTAGFHQHPVLLGPDRGVALGQDDQIPVRLTQGA